MIRQKLAILLEAKVIDQHTYEYVLRVLEYLLEEGIISQEQEADVFLTHLAMAHARQKNADAETIEALDADQFEEIEGEMDFDKAVELWRDLEAMAGIEFGEEEIGYFYAHIITMLRED